MQEGALLLFSSRALSLLAESTEQELGWAAGREHKVHGRMATTEAAAACLAVVPQCTSRPQRASNVRGSLGGIVPFSPLYLHCGSEEGEKSCGCH